VGVADGLLSVGNAVGGCSSPETPAAQPAAQSRTCKGSNECACALQRDTAAAAACSSLAVVECRLTSPHGAAKARTALHMVDPGGLGIAREIQREPRAGLGGGETAAAQPSGDDQPVIKGRLPQRLHARLVGVAPSVGCHVSVATGRLQHNPNQTHGSSISLHTS
jgi:hypothetical protein